MLQEDSTIAVAADSPAVCTLHSFAQEGYFAGSPYFHPELGVGRPGVAGDPVPYTFSNDNAMMGLLLAVSLLMLLSVVRSWSFIARQFRLFYHAPRRVAEASDEVSAIRHQRMLFFLCPVVLGTAYFMYRHSCLGDRFVLEPNVAVAGVFAAVSLAILLLRYALYSFANWVFFDRSQCDQWSRALLFFTTLCGLLSLPVVLAMAFFSVPLQFLLIYALSAVILLELLSFFRCFVIFFEGSAFPLQIILYFCTLELIPIAFLWTTLDMAAGYLAMNI